MKNPKRAVLTLLILTCFVFGSSHKTIAQGGSVLGNLAASMNAGEWRELNTTGFTQALLTNPYNGCNPNGIFVYADSAMWDPMARQVVFMGSPHCGGANGSKLIRYIEATNTWMACTWFESNPSCAAYTANVINHAYDHSAIDPATGDWYLYTGDGAGTVKRFNLSSSGPWTTIAASKIYPGYGGLSYFPELFGTGGLVLLRGGFGQIGLWNKSTNGWNLPTGHAMGNYHNFAEYNPVHHVVVGGGGNGNTDLYKIASSGAITKMNNAPIGLGVTSARFTVDPVTGDYLVLGGNNQFYKYDVLADSWALLPTPPFAPFMSSSSLHDMAVTPISTHGVTMFMKHDSTPKVYLYKHGAGLGTPAPPPPPPPVDTTPPSVSISSPANGATVSGTISITATASDAVAVAGVQFQLDGSNLANEDTSFPYSISWDTTSAANGSHTLTAIARDTAGNQAVSMPVSVVVNNTASQTPSGTLSFAQKCAQTGVINCFDFDDSNQLRYAWQTGTVCDAALAGNTRYSLTNNRGSNEGNTAATIQNGQCVYPQIDSGVKHSGNGALKFTIPSQSGANSSGFFTEPFKRNPDGTFAYIAPGSPLGNVVYWQFYQYFDPTFLNTTYVCIGGTPSNPSCGGWKQIIWYGNPPNGTSSSLMEITHNNGWQKGIPTMYGQAGYDGYGYHDVRGCTYNFNGQYTYPEPPCIRYKAGQWMEFTVRVEIRGNPNAPESRIQLWVDGQLAIDYQKAKVNWGAADGNGLGQFQITPYHTNKDSSHVHPVGYTWYDDVIISTQPIPMVNGSTTPPPSETTPPVISNVSSSNVFASSATITWSTDEASDSQVEYGTTTSYGNATSINASMVTSHSLVLSGLSAATTYNYRVRSRDAAGNLSVSNNFTFATGTSSDMTPPIISNVTAWDISTFDATINWTTNEPADTQVEYGTTTSYGNETTLNVSLSTSHSQTLPGLASGTTYNYRVKSRDAAGNLAVSENFTFKTGGSPGETVPPTVSITAPASGSTVSGTVTISADAADNVGVAGVRFKLNGLDLGPEDTTAPYSLAWNTTTVANGTQSLTAVARDAAGNQATSEMVTVTVNNASLPPASPPSPISEPLKFSIPQNGGEAWTITGSSDSITIAHAELETNYSSMFSGLAIFGFRINGVTVTEASVPASPAITSGRIYAEVDGPVNTGIALANPTAQDALVTFYFTDNKGNDIRPGSFTLKAKSQLAAFLNQEPFNGGEAIQGTLTFNSTVRLGVIALRGFTNERYEFLITTLPVSSFDETTTEPVVLPHFADSGGWSTRLILTNPSDSPISGTVNFLDAAGNDENTLTLRKSGITFKGSSVSYAIPARSFTELTTLNRDETIKTGSVRITPAEGVAPSASGIFSYRNNGVTVTEAGVAVLRAGDAFRMYAEVSSPQGGSIDSGLALANPKWTPITVTLELIRMDGTWAAIPVTLTLPAYGQVARFIRQLFPTLSIPFSGYLRVSGTGPFCATGLRGRYNERGDFLITTTAPQQETFSPPTSSLVFPQIVGGGGYSTQLILIGEGGGGNIQFSSQNGSPTSDLSRTP